MNHPNYVVCLFVTLYCVLLALHFRLPHARNTEFEATDSTRRRRVGREGRRRGVKRENDRETAQGEAARKEGREKERCEQRDNWRGK